MKNILITGPPRVGKTTLIQRLTDSLKNFRPAGFYTEEILSKDVRKGFRLVSLCGETGLLAHVDIQSRFRVGRYGVDVNGFDAFMDRLDLVRADTGTGLVVIDEIGKMECFSLKFIHTVNRLLDSDKTVIATIALKGGSEIEKIKKRSDVIRYELTPRNRHEMLSKILSRMR